MNIPCPTCSPCPNNVVPTTGYQSETPDVDLVIAYNYGIPGVVPPLNSHFTQTACVVFCESPTEEQAEQCAEVAQIECLSAPPNQCGGSTGQSVFVNNPQSCSLECPDGLPFVFTVPQGTYAAFTQAQADAMASSFACTQVEGAKVCLGNLPGSACTGVAYSGIVAAVGIGPYRFAIVAGSLPPGLQLGIIDSFHFSVQGTPTQAGTFSFTMEAVDPRENFINKVYIINVGGITTASPLPNGTTGTAYDVILMSTVTPPVTWSILSGSLPAGLSLNTSTGEITGTPTTNGLSTFTVEAGICQKQFTITVGSSTPWTPAVVSPLHWYAADQISGFTSGQALYNWPDLGTGNNANGANSGGGTPLYLTNQLNGLPIVSWTNPGINNANLRFQNSGWTPGVNNPLNPSWDGFSQANVFIVIQPVLLSASPILMQVGATSGVLLQTIMSGGAGNPYGVNVKTHAADSSTLINGTINPTGSYDILAAQLFYSTAQAAMRVNGSQSFSGQGFNSAGTTLGSTATQFLADTTFNTTANIAEIIVDVVNQPLSIIQKYEGYLAWKWGLQGNLPPSHPYKNSPPTQ